MLSLLSYSKGCRLPWDFPCPSPESSSSPRRASCLLVLESSPVKPRFQSPFPASVIAQLQWEWCCACRSLLCDFPGCMNTHRASHWQLNSRPQDKLPRLQQLLPSTRMVAPGSPLHFAHPGGRAPNVCVQPSALSLSVPCIPAARSGLAQIRLPVPAPCAVTLSVLVTELRWHEAGDSSWCPILSGFKAC